MNYRTALADYVTIFTGLITLAGGVYSFYAGEAPSGAMLRDEYWGAYLQHSITTAVTFVALYFFMDQSIKISRRVAESQSSALPSWLIYGLFYVCGMALFFMFQIVFQSNFFDEIQIVYPITSLSIWLVITIPLMIVSLFNGKDSKRSRRGRHSVAADSDSTPPE